MQRGCGKIGVSRNYVCLVLRIFQLFKNWLFVSGDNEPIFEELEKSQDKTDIFLKNLERHKTFRQLLKSWRNPKTRQTHFLLFQNGSKDDEP